MFGLHFIYTVFPIAAIAPTNKFNNNNGINGAADDDDESDYVFKCVMSCCSRA